MDHYKKCKEGNISQKKVITSNKSSKQTVQSDCKITDVENVTGPNRTLWPEYCYYLTNQTWQQQACARLGIRSVSSPRFQPGDPDVVLTRPDLRSLRSVQRDGNCLFRAHSYVVTDREAQHMEVCKGITGYMFSIKNLLVDYDSTGHTYYLVLLMLTVLRVH